MVCTVMAKDRAPLQWSVEQARVYQLWAVGLHGRAYPVGEDGIRKAFCDLGTIQLDPLPVLGRNQDLVIQARVDGTHPDETLDLIHRERIGFEYWNKALCIIPIEAFPQFRVLMTTCGDSWEARREKRLKQKYPGAIEAVYDAVTEHGPVSSRELKSLEVAQGDHREWKSTKAANAALEVLWNRGKLSVTHRVNYRRYFNPTESVIPTEIHKAPAPTSDTFWTYLLKKRVRLVGLLPAKGDSEAWSFLHKVRRNRLPERLVEKGELIRVEVGGIKPSFYALPDAEEVFEQAKACPFQHRARFVAPLDPLLWARTALHRLWDFEYAWEVYKPASKRRWGYYVLPVLYRERFVARFDGRYNRKQKALHVLAYYEEPDGLPLCHPAIHAAFQRFLAYLEGEQITLPTGETWDRENLKEGIGVP
jgi:uncharacterized protein YcaQ